MSEVVVQAPKSHLRDYPVNAGIFAVTLLVFGGCWWTTYLRVENRIDQQGLQIADVRVGLTGLSEQVKALDQQVKALDKRVERIESKLDRVIELLAKRP